jgi:hypothetical protein
MSIVRYSLREPLRSNSFNFEAFSSAVIFVFLVVFEEELVVVVDDDVSLLYEKPLLLACSFR